MKNIELTGLPVDQRGHRFLSKWAETETLDAFVSVVDESDPWTTGYAMVHNAFSCANCDAHASFDVVAHADGPEGVGLRARTECLLPDGAENVFHLTVTSGKIVVADDLRPVFPGEPPLTPGYSSSAGQLAFSAQQATAGVATGATTNTGAYLVRLGHPQYGATDGGRYAIVTFDDEAEPGDDDFFDLGPHGEVLARIDCAVWSYAIADYADFKTRLDRLSPEEREHVRDYEVIDFPPGTYQFVHHTTRADVDAHDSSWPIVWADIAQIAPRHSRDSNEPEPLADTLAVADMMRAFGQTVRHTPTSDLDDAERLLRARLVFEEALEFVEAMGCTVATSGHDLVTKGDAEVLLDPAKGIDLVEALDAIADLTVVTKGSAHTLGAPVDAAFNIVHATNMAKFDPETGEPYVKDAGGKVGKPEGWVPPTEALRDLLIERGWTTEDA